ncbi:hypothetical protein Tco_1500878 [Tanacetum coccineum]
MASLDRRSNHLYAIKECSSCGNLHTKDCGCPKGSLEGQQILVSIPSLTLEEVFQDFQDTSKSSNDDTNFVNQEPFVVKQGPGVNSSQSPPHINLCCYECGNSLDDIFCQQCTCKSCGKGAHYGYNYPPQIPIISKPEPCNNQTVNEFPQTLPSVQPTSCTGDENSFTYDSKPNFVDDSPNVFNPPPQPPTYPYENYGNDAYYGYDCSPQVPFIYPEPCYSQDFNFPQNSQTLKQHSETIIDSNDDSTSSDDDSYENIDYVDASPPDAEIVSLEVVEIVIPKVGGIDTDILRTIKDDILRGKIVGMSSFIANIEALKKKGIIPPPSSVVMTKFPPHL